MRWTDILQAASAVVVACFTVMLAYVAKSTLTATKTAAEAAKKSADVAEKSVNNIERAFVLPQNIEPKIKPYMATSRGPPPSGAPYVNISLRNYGRSPALILEIRASLEMFPTGQTHPPFSVPAVPLNNILLIGSYEPWDHTCHHANLVGDAVRLQIENSTFHFWFFISVRYEDMLGNEHQTQMRFRYDSRDDRFVFTPGDDYTVRT
jgi:hypothetical protein